MSGTIGGQLMTIERNTVLAGTGTDVIVCGKQEGSVNITANTREVKLPDCTTPTNPVKVFTNVDSTKTEVSGTFVIVPGGTATADLMTDLNTSREWFYTVKLAGLGKWAGKAIVTQATIQGNIDNDATVNLTLVFNGTPTYTSLIV